MIRPQYNQRFLELLGQLNAAQRNAVEQIEGPVLAVAGPGTGKTHMLTARVGKILLDTDAQAQNVLCLTFTEAGAHAMRERLLEFIGPEAHRVPIHTFHSFCNNIIRDNLEAFGRQDLEPLSDLERVEAVREVVDGLPAGHPLLHVRTEPYFYENHLRQLFRDMKSENWTADTVQRATDEYLETLPERAEYQYQRRHGNHQKGDLKTGKLDDMVLRLERLRAAAALLPEYERVLQRRRRYDYEDMQQWVLRAFAENENLLRNYQERYLYYLVDEFQDTNGAQLQLLYQLIGFWDAPNIFVVGDDDQSIFEFQGARLRNVADFAQRYQNDLSIVLLEENYRSSQHILDASKSLIDQNELRLLSQIEAWGGSGEKVLLARSTFADTPIVPVFWSYPNRAQEEAGLVAEIERLHREEGIPLHEMAVLYARHKQAVRLMGLLEKKRIAYETRRRVNVLELPVVKQLLGLLRYLAEEMIFPGNAEGQLFETMHYGCWGNDPRDLAALSLMRQHGQSYLDLLDTLTPGQAERLRKPESLRYCAEIVVELLRAAADEPLPALVERATNRSGLLQAALDHADRYWLVQALGTFHRFVTEECGRSPQLSLQGLLDLLERMRANKISLGLEKVVTGGNGLHLLTAFAAKGLEYRVVFLLDCTDEAWEPNRVGQKHFVYPETLIAANEETDAMEAARRVFYVAMTRAQERLYICCAKHATNGELLTRTRFVDELLAAGQIVEEVQALPDALMLETERLLLGSLSLVETPRLATAQVQKLLENFQLSPTALNRFLNCPLTFYYENVLAVPVGSSEHAAYGNAVHRALQWAFGRLAAAKGREFPSADHFVAYFETEMQRARGLFGAQNFDRVMALAKQNLPVYYRQRTGQWDRQAVVEKTLRHVEYEGTPLTGTIDKIVFLPNGDVALVDYKSGKIDPARLAAPSEKHPHGGEYWRQLLFYKLLYEQSRYITAPARYGVIDYLTPDAQGAFPTAKVVYDAEAFEAFRPLLLDTWARIQAHDFYTGCGKPTCRWCTFERDHIAPATFSDEAIEAMDDL